MKGQYDEASALYKQEIRDIKNALQNAQIHAQAVKENIRIVMQTNREKFSAQLKAAMDKGWEAWAAQAAELHTYRADWENHKKEGRGFYKLSEETVATVREDLAKDYRELSERHSEEIAQILEDFGEGQEELLDTLMEDRDKHPSAGTGVEQELAGTTADEQASPHDPIEGETSLEQTQAPVNPQPQESIMERNTEQEIQPPAGDAQETEGST